MWAFLVRWMKRMQLKRKRNAYISIAKLLTYFYQSLSDKIFGEIMYMKTAHDIWLYLNLIYRRVSDDDVEPKEEVHECVEHDHNLVIVEDCSTSWSSDDDDDDRSTTSSLDKMDDDTPSEANDDFISSTLGDDGSCSSHDCDATTSPSTTPHCFMVTR